MEQNIRTELDRLLHLLSEARLSASYVCEHCKDPFEGALLHGVWGTISNDVRTIQTYINLNEAREEGTV
jgi:hypothetical protein